MAITDKLNRKNINLINMVSGNGKLLASDNPAKEYLLQTWHDSIYLNFFNLYIVLFKTNKMLEIKDKNPQII